MTRRQTLIDIIQALSAEEGTRQPTAAAWLQEQDDLAAARASSLTAAPMDVGGERAGAVNGGPCGPRHARPTAR